MYYNIQPLIAEDRELTTIYQCTRSGCFVGLFVLKAIKTFPQPLKSPEPLKTLSQPPPKSSAFAYSSV